MDQQEDDLAKLPTESLQETPKASPSKFQKQKGKLGKLNKQ